LEKTGTVDLFPVSEVPHLRYRDDLGALGKTGNRSTVPPFSPRLFPLFSLFSKVKYSQKVDLV